MIVTKAANEPELSPKTVLSYRQVIGEFIHNALFVAL